MTAVAPPLTITAGSRAWTAGSAAPNSMDQDVSRMFMPRRPISRTGSSSSINSNSSTATVTQTTEGQQSGPYDSLRAGSEWNAKPKLARGLWTSKAEPTVGLSGARTNGLTNGVSGQTSMAALTPSTPLVPSQHVLGSQTLPAPRIGQNPETPAVLLMTPLNATFAKKTIHVPYYPDVLKIGRQTNARTVPTTTNGFFDSKVLSRQHAEIYADKAGKIWIRDIKSSNGTFVNGQRLSPENRESEPHELHENDTLELGIDIISEDQKTVVHHKVAARVEHAGLYTGPLAGLDMNFAAPDPNALAQQQRRRDFLNNPAGPQPQPLTRNGVNTTMPAAGAMVPGSKTNFWIHPVTMEQIVKQLTTELRAAKQQSSQLHQTAEFFDNVLEDPSKPHTNGVLEKTTEPPAPTDMPAPAKPVSSQADHFFPSLNRSDTERPEIEGPAATPDLVSLSSALAQTKKSLEEQTERVKNLEIMLLQERTARESAEDRASKLEKQQTTPKLPESATENAKSVESTARSAPEDSDLSDKTIEVATARMQARVEQMAVEMDEMRKALDGYKKRAEKAEAERDFSRKNLAEMVERIRKEEDARKAAETKAIAASAAAAAAALSVDKSSSTPKASVEIGDRDTVVSGSSTLASNGELLKRNPHQNGKTPHPGEALQSGTGLSHALARRDDGSQAILASAPYASVIGVIALGLSVMALLNRWQKTEQ